MDWSCVFLILYFYFFILFTEGDNVEVDESLFQDLEDLDIGDADIDIED